MVYQSGTDTEQQPALTHAIKTMPRWKWRLLGLALVIGCIGVAGQVSTYLKSTPAPGHASNVPQAMQPSPTTPAIGAPAGSSGFVAGQPSSSTPAPDATPQAQVEPESSFIWKALMTRVGFSLFIGVIVGVIFRVFLRTALLISALIVSAAMALSYFHIMNVDLTMVKAQTAQATNWISDQGYRLKDVLFHALPSSTSAGIGFFLGLKRR